jgi:hypothetical protein
MDKTLLEGHNAIMLTIITRTYYCSVVMFARISRSDRYLQKYEVVSCHALYA